jgi:ATP-binding protein involved in chromosome partitioning
MFNQVKVPLIGVVENMSYFVCPHCGGRTDVFSHGGARKEAEKLGVPFLGEAPLDVTIRINSDDGRPVVATMPESPQANAFLEIARRVADTLAVGAPGAKPAPRIRILD